MTNRPLLIGSLLLLLSGCAQYYIKTGQLDNQLDNWEQAHQYQKAIDALDQLPPSHPNLGAYTSRRQALERQQSRFINNTDEQANALARKRQWQAAIELYQQALDGNPGQPRLQKGLDNLVAQRQIYNTKLQHQLNLEEASTLRRRLQLYSELARSDPDRRDYQRTLETLREQQQSLYQFLVRCAEDGLEFTNFTHGQHCLNLAQGIRPEQLPKKPLIQLSQRYQQLDKRSASARERRNLQQLSALEQRYKAALAQQDYLKARELLDQQEQLNPDSSHLLSTRLELEAEIEQYVAQQMQLGANAYTAGQIEQSLKIWKPLQPLSPDNLTLQADIQRAERFTQKLKSLQKTQ
ncbi:hypothetical protein [Aestuariirhabdus litorea]|uniref:Tetratricopeptide repeat protein n=1 Tax=Aestuariirhabdus litorea TaxID=2528527 RepID=A0A3P3VMY1_9GAMM|nr:hypothetical protein [Aestuariirhabdus litorea]RRJ83697.1 hypothetical protein D0544_00825 [Aestuariirhabdus litorea]RWW96919.1 hypothetical protein DZC74_00825 [Endozoicomonadaceae bacterium GTF-13]